MNAGVPAPVIGLPGERARKLDVNGLRLNVREWGGEDAPAVVLLHGLRGFSGTWRSLAAALADELRLVALDLRGRGSSDWDPQRNYYTDTYLSDVECVVDQLRLDHFVLLGHSMGGTVAYVYASRHPQRLRGLIIEDIAPGASIHGDGAARIIAEMARLPESFPDWEAARTYWRDARRTVGTQAIEQRLAESLHEDAKGRIQWRYDAAGIKVTRMFPDPARVVDLWPVVECIRTPTLVIRGTASDFCPLDATQRMCSLNPNITYVSLQGASHYVHDDLPDEFNEEVRRFLARLPVSPTT